MNVSLQFCLFMQYYQTLAALIIPSFSTDMMIDVPSNKSQLLQLMKNGTIEGYR